MYIILLNENTQMCLKLFILHEFLQKMWRKTGNKPIYSRKKKKKKSFFSYIERHRQQCCYQLLKLLTVYEFETNFQVKIVFLLN